MADMTLKAVLLGEDKSMGKTFKGVGKEADSAGAKLGKFAKVGLVGIASVGAAAAVGGIAAVGVAMVNGVKDAAAYQTLALKTAAVLKSTGNVAHQSVKGIQARAAALESMSGVEEEVIINAQNVLATFTKVRDGVGKGNDIFNQATTAALNMSTALGTDLQGATLQVGKALNDPIKGITALRRAGVSFDAQQVKTIKTMVKAGDTMGAQKLILGELSKEFGGAAKAAGSGFEGSMARAKDAVQDAFRSIGMRLLPVITKLADYVAKNAGPFIDGFTKTLGNIWRKVGPGLKSLFGWFKNDLWPALQKGYQTVMPALKKAFDIIAGAFKDSSGKGTDFKEVVKKVGNFVTQILIPALSWLAKTVLPLVATHIRLVIEAVKALAKWFGWLWSNVMRPTITLILNGFAAVATGIGKVLVALGHIPGFGWAKTAGEKMLGAAAAAKALAKAINAIPAKKTVTVNTYFVTHGDPNPLSTQGSGAGVKGYASGGTNIPAGLAWVGENGPELMYVPGGSSIYTNSESMRMAASGNAPGGGGNYTLTLVVKNESGQEIQRKLLALKRGRGMNLGLA